MRNKFFLIIILMFLQVNSLLSQNISGTVVDRNNLPVSDASILLKNNDAKITSVQSDETGKFSLSFKSVSDYTLEISHLGFKKSVIQINNCSQSLNLGEIILFSDTIVLNEITVQSTSQIQKVDRQILFPNTVQKESSFNGFSLLKKLSLAGIKVNDLEGTVTSLSNAGTVLLQINGAKAEKQEITAINPKNILRIEYIDNPGIKYGENIGSVINFILKQQVQGFNLGVNLNNAITTGFGNDNFYAKYNQGISQFSVIYSTEYKSFNDIFFDEVNNYKLLDNTEETITSKGLESNLENREHNLLLKYNLYKVDKFVFNITLKNTINNSPVNSLSQLVSDSKYGNYGSKYNYKDDFSSPAFDVYSQIFLPKGQTITFDLVGSYIKSNYSYEYQEFDSEFKILNNSYQYTTIGSKQSVIGEANYEKKFKLFTLTSGVNYLYNQLENSYYSEQNTISNMINSNYYVYSQIDGKIKQLSYVLGVGLSSQKNTQNSIGYSYWTFRPNITLSYPIFKNSFLKYNFNIRPNLPKLANISDVSLQKNVWEIVSGNPNLKPFRNIINKLTFVYYIPNFVAQYSSVLMLSRNAIMPLFYRTNDDVFVSTAKNQKSMNQWVNQLYIRYDVIPEKISLSGYGGLNNFYSNGDNYTHHNSTFFGGLQADMYFGKWNFSGNIDSRYLSYFGETVWYNEYSNSLAVSYTHKNMRFGLEWMYPFQKKGMNSGEITNSEYFYKKKWNTYNDYSNMIVLKLSWNLQKGKKYKDKEKVLENSDKDSGIIKSK